MFNFNFPALVDSEIIGGSKFKLGGLHPINARSGKNCTLSESFTTSDSVFNFNFLAVVVPKIIAGPKFKLGGSTPPERSLAESFVPEASTLPPLIALLISTF